MTLLDGLKFYEHNDSAFWKFTSDVEERARKLSALLADDNYHPTEKALEDAHQLLVDIERWKAGCIEEVTGHWAVENSPRDVWNACRAAIKASTDRDGILSIMRLKGFGASRNEQGQHPAKRASAVMRMFMPAEWGVVDWRNVAMLNVLNNVKWDVDLAMGEAEAMKKQLKALYKDMPINEAAAIVHNQMYRDARQSPLLRTAAVEMAIFGLTLQVWPWLVK
jgi:hypothetical protein